MPSLSLSLFALAAAVCMACGRRGRDQAYGFTVAAVNLFAALVAATTATSFG